MDQVKISRLAYVPKKEKLTGRKPGSSVFPAGHPAMSAHTRPLPALAWRLPHGTVAAGLRRVWRVATTRHALAQLDDRLLRDIGVSRAEVAAELHRAPWDTGRR
jgi:uncharacterized protein YjiS (DUF1127 family)